MLPPRLKALIESDTEPGELYREALRHLADEHTAVDYSITEAIVYATELRYALDILQNGPPPHWHNFGDRRGDADRLLWSMLDPIDPLRVALVGSGPYPVTALQIQSRRPDARVTCIDNHVVAYEVSRALARKLGLALDIRFEDAIDVDYRPYNACVVAAMVRGKTALVARMLDACSATIIVRGRVPLHHVRLVQFPADFSDDGTIDMTPR